MSDAEFQQLLETSLRRRLTGAEQKRLHEYLQQNPPARALWDEETGLSRLLAGLPDVPLSSNFTARVLQSLDRDSALSSPRARVLSWLRLSRPAHRIAWACAVVVLFAGAGYRQVHQKARARMAASVTSVAEGVESTARLAQLSSVELWRDFESISRLPVPRADRAGADEELLAALQ